MSWSQTKEARREASRKYRAAHPEENREYQRNYQRMWKHKNPQKRLEYFRRWFLQEQYGVSEEVYDAVLKAQDNACAICDRKPPFGKQKYLSVDHNHETKQFRGLLCPKCNTAISRFAEDPRLLITAAFYLGIHDNWDMSAVQVEGINV